VLHADVRIIAAANTPIDKLLSGSGFRQDLYYRLNVVPLHIPPLRERREDITALINHLLTRLAARYQRPHKVLGSQAWAQAMRYDWPGNVRELENVLERAFLFARGQVIDELDVRLPDETGVPHADDLRRRRQGAVRDVEIKTLREALLRQNGNVSAVAREIGITPRAVHQKLRGYGIEAAGYRKPGR